jgi:hypothetical protein
LLRDLSALCGKTIDSAQIPFDNTVPLSVLSAYL